MTMESMDNNLFKKRHNKLREIPIIEEYFQFVLSK